MVRERLDSQNIANGLMIAFVVMMHTVQEPDLPVWRVAISSFHVPLFFLVSGIAVGRAENGWAAYIRNNALALLVPYFVWALISAPFTPEALPWVLYGNWAALKRIGANAALWFLPAIFCARLMFEATMRVIEGTPVRRLPAVFLAAAVSFAVGMILPQPALGYPLGLHCALIALGFLLLGSVVGDCLKVVERWRFRILMCVMLAAMALFAYGAFLRPGEHVLVGMAEFKFGSRFWFYWNALSGCAAVVLSSVALSSLPAKGRVLGPVRRYLVWLGRNTIGVLILHVPVARQLVVPCLRACGLDCSSWYGALTNVAVTLAIVSPTIRAVQLILPRASGWLGLREMPNG